MWRRSVCRQVEHKVRRSLSAAFRMKRTAIVYWLIPAEAERELFCEIVRILCKQFGAPNFDPHLTLFSTIKDRQSRGSLRRSKSPRAILCQIRSAPIRLSVRGVTFSSQFTKTLFVQFKSSKSLAKLIVNLARATELPAKSLRDPHVSLLYKRVQLSTKRELAATIKLPVREVVFDTIAAVRCASPTRTRRDVQGWKIVAKKSLRG